jgi:carotenoid cleavage dioxygenase-like enzyme
MAGYPITPDFTELNTPVRVELDVRNLPVEGEIPREINGAFFRAVPDPAHPPLFEDDTGLSADGMVARFLIEDGHVDYAIKYVKTARYLAEEKARKALFGRYRNPYTDDKSVEGVDRTVSNTTPVWHAGRLYMTKEDGRAYEIDPLTLDTLGSWDFHGALKSQTMTAHVRIDPDTGEMFFYGYEAGGLCTDDLAYCIADKDGKLIYEQWFKLPYCGMMHDFAITEKYAIFPLFPTTADLERIKAGGPHWAHDQDLECWIGIMPRYGDASSVRGFKGPKGVSAFHIINAFDGAGDKVVMDIHVSETNMFPFMREAAGIKRNNWEIPGSTQRWIFDLAKDGDSFEMVDIGPPGDLPRLPDAQQGRPYHHAWYLTMNPEGGPPLTGGPVGTAFNALLRIEPETDRLDMMGLPFECAINEPAHIPADDPNHEGWLLSVVDRKTGDDYKSELWVIDAGDIAKGPVAKVAMPFRMRPQVHGWWVPMDALKNARAAKR